MPKTNILAKIKKIDILNKTLGEDWKQTITLVLGEIELTDANLIAIRKFRPNEEVLVNLSTLQLSMDDLPEKEKSALLDKDTDATPAPLPIKPAASCEETSPQDLSLTYPDEEEAADASMIFVDPEETFDPSQVVKSFQF